MWVKSFDPLMRWFLGRTYIDVCRRCHCITIFQCCLLHFHISGCDVLGHMTSSHQVKMVRYACIEKETE